jgi:hypothetical protein
VRSLGTFLDNPEDAPAEVVEYVADQLGHLPSMLAWYGPELTRSDHENAVKDAYGYRDLKGDAQGAAARGHRPRTRHPVPLPGHAVQRAGGTRLSMAMVSTSAIAPSISSSVTLAGGGTTSEGSRISWVELAQTPPGNSPTKPLPTADSQRTRWIDHETALE